MGDALQSSRTSPCDSLSPLDDIATDKMKAEQDMFSDVIGFIQYEHLLDAPPVQTQQALDHVSACLEALLPPAIAKDDEEGACPPRSPLITRTHRPSALDLVRTNGLTTTSTATLRRHICDTRSDPGATTIQVPRPKSDNVPPTPGTPSPLFVMGNNASSMLPDALDDGASNRSKPAPVRMLRKSSANLLFKRHDSKFPLPSRLTTATVVQVQQQPAAPLLEVIEEYQAESPMIQKPVTHEPRAMTPSDRSSPETVTQDLPGDTTPTQASYTPFSQPLTENRHPRQQSRSDTDLRRTATLRRHSALSPTIPAPSPLPEDSPHKYGLRDRMDTPELPMSENIAVAPSRRRSSGLEVFHEAKSLQSASSFLNGLSTSRRRAESLKRSSESQLTTQATSRRSARQATGPRRPTSAFEHATSSDRFSGHNFKASGFAYARALAPAQLKCYQRHTRLTTSSNKRCPVECAVCHIDDDREHFSCSWCALRMCRFCKKEFAENGVTGLKERVKLAEVIGEVDEGHEIEGAERVGYGRGDENRLAAGE